MIIKLEKTWKFNSANDYVRQVQYKTDRHIYFIFLVLITGPKPTSEPQTQLLKIAFTAGHHDIVLES